MASDNYGGQSLDDLYKMVSYIYGDKNVARTSTSTLSHFVEICGMLTIHSRKKKREGIDVTDALCKALGWYFPLMAKLRVKSVEELIFRKFPNACPYCRLPRHDDAICKQVKGTEQTVNHDALIELYKNNYYAKPKNLDGWQDMFQRIYPRSVDDTSRSVVGLFEEIGELSEAVRVFEVHPEYLLGEAADIFSYLMGIANEHKLALALRNEDFSLQQEFISRFPGLCTQCGSRECICPSVPQATIGRMAKELPIDDVEDLFIKDVALFTMEGRQIAHTVLESVGGYSGLANQLPFDRGDTNRALVSLCLRIADAVEHSHGDVASNLRTEALRLSSSASFPGSPKKSIAVEDLLAKIGEAWGGLDQELRAEIKTADEMLNDIAEVLETKRVLYVFCSPQDEAPLRVSGEFRAIKDALRRGPGGSSVKLEGLPAATPQDLRRELLRSSYDIIHFAGHADEQSLVFENEAGESTPVSLVTIRDLVGSNRA